VIRSCNHPPVKKDKIIGCYEAVSKAEYSREDGKAERKCQLIFNTSRLTGKYFWLTFETISSASKKLSFYNRREVALQKNHIEQTKFLSSSSLIEDPGQLRKL
jgi:hypothetical protein